MSSTNRNANRIAQDAYQTPPHCIDPMLPYIDFRPGDVVMEPCRGGGNIYRRIPPFCELRWCEIQEGRDYLTGWRDGAVDIIWTNPPFSLATEFLEKSLGEARTVIYLLRLNFLGSQKRKEFWNKNRPSHLFVLSRRPSFTGGGKTDSTEYGWFVWDCGGRIKANHWLTVL